MMDKGTQEADPSRNRMNPQTHRNRGRYASVIPVSQIALSINSEDDDARFRELVQEVLRWIANRAGGSLPDAAWEMTSFETEEPGAQRIAAVKLEDPQIWAARIDDADNSVAMRTWVTEVAVAKRPKGGLLFGTRLTCTSRGQNPEISRSVPGFARQIVEVGGATLDGRPVLLEPWIVSSRSDVAELLDHLESPGRRSDTIVVSLPESSDNIDDAGIDVGQLVTRVTGAAHVAVITGDAAFHLSDRVGKEFSVFGKAVRTYRPGFDPEFDEQFDHPLGLWRRIENWEEKGPEAYTEFVANRVLENTVARKDKEADLPSFASLRALAAKQRRQEARTADASTGEMLGLVEEELAKVEAERDELVEYFDGELNEIEKQRDDAVKERDKLNQSVHNLKVRISYLQQAQSYNGTAVETPIPNDLAGFREWCNTHLSGAVEVLNRAHTGIKKSEYEDTSLIYKSLLLLRDYYVPLRRGEPEPGRDGYEQKLQELGLEETQSFTGPAAGEQGDTYKVKYESQNCFLDRHLKKGNSREPRFCFRLYFFWHQRSEQVVVGWLPSHLDTRAS